MSTSRIEELRAKFDENPRRYFAPLANELRKIGDHAAAIALCREYLPKQPGHMSGHIVYAQALFEVGELDEARTVFEAALALDPENLIALRHLGEIARANGDTALARRWYERVLDADPRNDEIAQQLSELFTPPATPAIPTPVQQAAHEAPAEVEGVEEMEATAGHSLETDAQAIDDAFAASASEAELLHFEPLVQESPVTAHEDEPWEEQEADVEDTLDAFEAHDPGDELDPHFGGSPTAAADVEEPVRLSELELSAEFEEGLIAPEWPDTSYLEARAEQEIQRTQSTPSYSEEAVAAFGREMSDPMDAAGAENDVVEYGEREAAETAADDEFVAHDEPVVTAETEAVDEFTAREEVTAEVDAIPSYDEQASDEGDPEVAHDAEAPQAQAEAEEVGATAHDLPTADYAVITGDYDAVEDEQVSVQHETPIAELPWVASDAQGEQEQSTTVEAESEEHIAAAIPESEPELREVAEAIARDARNSGETEAIRVAVHDEAETGDEDQPAFVTETMAELLVSQGFVNRAVTVYEELVRRRPFDVALARKLEALRARQEGRSETPAFGILSVTPQEQDAWQPDIQMAAEDAAPRRATPIVAPSIESEEESATSRPTARARFAQLASRRVPRRTPPRAAVAVETPADGLAGLFGTVSLDASDDYAARAFADAFAPMDEVPPGATLPGSAFVARTKGESREVVSSMPTPSHAAQQETPNSGFSFDRFFPDPATVSNTPATPADAARESNTPPAAQVGEDLAEFAAWLKGLDKP